MKGRIEIHWYGLSWVFGRGVTYPGIKWAFDIGPIRIVRYVVYP